MPRKKYYYVKDYLPGLGYQKHVYEAGSFKKVHKAFQEDKGRGHIYRKGEHPDSVILSTPQTKKYKKDKYGQVVKIIKSKKPPKHEKPYKDYSTSFAIKSFDQFGIGR